MHTAIVLGIGFAILAVCVAAGRFLGATPNAGMVMGAQVFLPLWLAGAAINMWMGVSGAGYSVREEFPIFLAIFAVPAVVAGIIWYKFA
jgi:hypothetical protein